MRVSVLSCSRYETSTNTRMTHLLALALHFNLFKFNPSLKKSMLTESMMMQSMRWTLNKHKLSRQLARFRRCTQAPIKHLYYQYQFHIVLRIVQQQLPLLQFVFLLYVVRWDVFAVRVNRQPRRARLLRRILLRYERRPFFRR